jgi:hypothetical protein
MHRRKDSYSIILVGAHKDRWRDRESESLGRLEQA